MGPTTVVLSPTGRWLVLATAFLGWLSAGMIMSTTSQAMRAAAFDLLENNQPPSEGEVQQWFAYFSCAFLLGAATGGLVFGRLGDLIGRSRAMACSVLCFSALSGVAYFAQTPFELLILWFLACLGVGGMWPNGVALVAETWGNLSRPMVAGLMGTSANIGIFGFATLCAYFPIRPDNWRWVLLVDTVPFVLGLFILAAVPESPRWQQIRKVDKTSTPMAPVFRRPYLGITLVGILLATIPMIGGWGSANWMVPWAAQAGAALDPADHVLSANVGQARSLTGIVGSLLGGWVGHLVGRRLSFCLTSLAALICAQYTFLYLVPTDASFLYWVGALGFFSGIYFGWMPLFLPELFPTHVRSTGAGVSFNFGRYLTAGTVFATGALSAYFQKDYGMIGRVTSLVFLVGIFAIWLAPDTTKQALRD